MAWGRETVCESVSPCPDAPVTTTRRQQREQSIAWVEQGWHSRTGGMAKCAKELDNDNYRIQYIVNK